MVWQDLPGLTLTVVVASIISMQMIFAYCKNYPNPDDIFL
ncbi:hypothetical protein ABAC460_15040 [Asticcacaulis sp. AC460]|nr:hypothetical protein ABAC460_15040 [Asticcacaulis sp. AC460]